MLDIEARLARQAIGIAVSKAMEGVKGNTRRSIRNLIDLGMLFSQSENQKWFFGTAKNMLESPKNPYNALVSRAVRDIDNETIRRVGLNLGYNALMFGAKKLRKKQDALGISLPWLLDLNGVSDAEFPSRLECCLNEGQELGIYSYTMRLNGTENLPGIVELARKYEDCFFALGVSGELVDAAASEQIAQAHNVAVAVDIPEERELAEGAFRHLREHRCLYGCFLRYGDADVPRVTSPQFVRWGIGEGCLFGVYQAAAGASQRARDAVYDFVCRVRGESGQPLIALDWPRDIRETGEKLRVGGLISIDLAGKAFALCREARSPAGALAELFRWAQVCPT